jgi:hypothetical protein
MSARIRQIFTGSLMIVMTLLWVAQGAVACELTDPNAY